MILIKNIILKLFFLCLLFIFNIQEINSNSDKKIIYSLNNIHEENYYKLHLKNINTLTIQSIINKYNLNILSYSIDNNIYYANNLKELTDKFIKDLSLEKQIYYKNNGINIDYITLRCEVETIIELEKQNIIY